MNIFVLSIITKLCAQYHTDKHVVKMILEYAQLLCSAHIILDNVTEINNIKLYNLTHKNHPCSIWVRQSSMNYVWLYNLFYHLCKEYTYRYNKIHTTELKLLTVLKNIPKNINNSPEMTRFALAMPNIYKVYENEYDDDVESYRNYYINGKQHIANWKNRPIPHWMIIL